MLIQKYNPTLRDLLKVDSLPPNLGFLQNSLGTFLDKLFYKNLVAIKSSSGNSASYTLDIITYKKLTLLSIPGTDIAFVLNPSPTSNGSVFNVSFAYSWEILKYIRNANLQSFGFDLRSYLNLLSNIFGITQQEFLSETIVVFIGDFNNPPQNEDPLQDFVNKYNSNHTNQLTYTPNFTTFQDLVNQLQSFNEDFFKLIIDDYLNNVFEKLKLLIAKFIGPLDEERLKDLLLPQFSASINNIAFGIEFPQSIFIPIDSQTQEPTTDPTNLTTLIVNAGSFSYSTKDGFLFNPNLNFTFPKSAILGTGFTLDVQGLKIDLSETRNIPEANDDGRPNDFKGVYIKEATIGFPAFWNHNPNGPSTGEVKARNLLCGTGGISGTLALELKPSQSGAPNLVVSFGNFSVELDEFDITFQQNAILESNIHGKLKIPGFKDASGNQDAEIDILVHVGTGGDFQVTASEAQGLVKIKIPNILDLTVNSVSIGRESSRFFLDVSGIIDFKVNLPALGDILPKELDIKSLRIWDDGQIELKGGTITLPKAVTLKIPPVELSITAIGCSSYEKMFHNNLRKYKVFEFSGGVSINPGGVDVRGEGVQLFFTKDNIQNDDDFFIRIKGIGIDIIIPGSATKESATLIVKGFLSMKDAPTNTSAALDEYAGGIDFLLPKAKMGGSAAMRMIPKLPAFIIDISLEMSSPIPLGSTGLGIYGFRGLVGQRYVATKNAAGLTENDEWWRYYKAKISPDYKEGIQVSKFEPKSGFSIGAGVSLATTSDSGKSLSTKLFLLLSLPEVFLFQGQAAILKERIGLDTTTDPPFFALIAITPQSVEAAFGIDYKTPEDSGNIATVQGIIEMGFFFGNSGAWYINIGKDLPESRRIQARILNLFNAYYYLMLSSGGLRTGAGASWEFKKSFGPVGVELGAYIDVAGRINFLNQQPTPVKRHVQLGGSIQLGGYARIKVFKFKFGFTITAGLAAEAPKPFIVTGTVTISIDLPKPFKDIDVDIEFTWTFDSTLNTAEAELMDTEQLALKQPARAVNILTKETYEVLYYLGTADTTLKSMIENANPTSKYSVPMDSRIEIEFFKGVLPVISDPSVAKFGGFTTGSNFTDLIPPQQGKSQQILHEYRVREIKILSWDGSAWVSYDIFLANTSLLSQPLAVPQSVLNTLKYGFWQLDDPNGNPKKYTKLSVLAQDPLTFLSSGAGGLTPEDFGITSESIFCPPDPIEPTCVEFDDADFTVMHDSEPKLLEGKLLMRMVGADGQVIPVQNQFNFLKGFVVKSGSSLEVFFSQPVTTIDWKLSTKANDVKIAYYRRKQKVVNNIPVVTPSQLPVYEFELIREDTILQSNLFNPVIYNDINNPVDKAVIQSGSCTPGAVVCDTTVTPTANHLETFLNTLVQNHDLTKPMFNLSSNPAYANVFCNTDLYTGNSPSCDVIYTSTVSPTKLTATLKDMGDFLCNFSLELVQPSSLFNWSQVTSLHSIQLDPSHTEEGPHYDFFITASIPAAGAVQNFLLKGTSDCWPIIFCHIFDFLLHEPAAQDVSGYIVQENDMPTDRGRIIIDEDKSPACSTLVFEICWLTYIDQLTNTNAPNGNYVNGDNQAMVDGINLNIHPVWRPHTLFAIQVKTEDKLSTNPGNPNTRYHTFGFRTEGTIGFWHEDKKEFIDLKNKDREENFKLSSLKYYIDYGKSYPNADGDLLNAKPIFYKNPVLRMFYVKDYVYSMLSNWGAYNGNLGVDIELETLIKDPVVPTTPPLSPSFESNNVPVVPENISLLNNILQNSIPCSNVSGPLNPPGIDTIIQVPDYFLKPLKLYNAIFNVKKKFSNQNQNQFERREIHRYNFQTSQYATFKEQIESYILSATQNKYAIFTIERAFDAADIALATQTVLDSLPDDHALRQEFAEQFDRLMDGAFKMNALAAAVTTEFNIIKDSNTGNILGVLIRNPEPFNDPKLPAAVLYQTLVMSLGIFSGFTVIFSKDRSKAFITNNTLNIGTGNASFVFKYFEFTGSNYVALDTQTVQFTIS